MRALTVIICALLCVTTAGCSPLTVRSRASSAPSQVDSAPRPDGDSVASEMDAFIEREYPTFDVEDRYPVEGFRGVAAPGNVYVLRSTRVPRFVLAVTLIKPEKVTKELAALELTTYRDYYSTDDVFAQTMIERTWLTPEVIEPVMKAFVGSLPTARSIVARTRQTDGLVGLGIDVDPTFPKGPAGSFELTPTLVGQAEIGYPLHKVTRYEVSPIAEK